jgi:membrane associated rhomboid family serine protease
MFPVSDVIPSRTTPYVTYGLIVLNSLIFLLEWRLTPTQLDQLVRVYGVVPAAFSWLSLLTSQFLHAGWVHFGGNMLYLWIFGDNVEDSLGHVRFTVFYLLCGAAAGLVQGLVHPHSLTAMIGASGAIAGVMGAYFVLYPRSQVLTAIFVIIYLELVEIPAVFFLGIWFLMQLFSTVGSLGADAADGGTAFFAHLAGFALGAVVGGIWRLRGNAYRY